MRYLIILLMAYYCGRIQTRNIIGSFSSNPIFQRVFNEENREASLSSKFLNNPRRIIYYNQQHETYFNNPTLKVSEIPKSVITIATTPSTFNAISSTTGIPPSSSSSTQTTSSTTVSSEIPLTSPSISTTSSTTVSSEIPLTSPSISTTSSTTVSSEIPLTSPSISTTSSTTSSSEVPQISLISTTSSTTTTSTERPLTSRTATTVTTSPSITSSEIPTAIPIVNSGSTENVREEVSSTSSDKVVVEPFTSQPIIIANKINGEPNDFDKFDKILFEAILNSEMSPSKKPPPAVIYQKPLSSKVHENNAELERILRDIFNSSSFANRKTPTRKPKTVQPNFMRDYIRRLVGYTTFNAERKLEKRNIPSDSNNRFVLSRDSAAGRFIAPKAFPKHPDFVLSRRHYTLPRHIRNRRVKGRHGPKQNNLTLKDIFNVKRHNNIKDEDRERKEMFGEFSNDDFDQVL